MLETERLVLRLPTTADEDMGRYVDQWERGGVGKFVVVRREDGAVLGRVGIQLLDGEPELGWTLRPEYWGHGYATEAARAVLDWYEADRIVSLIQPDNARSQAVARRLGAVPERTVTLDDGPYVVWVHGSAKMGTR